MIIYPFISVLNNASNDDRHQYKMFLMETLLCLNNIILNTYKYSYFISIKLLVTN